MTIQWEQSEQPEPTAKGPKPQAKAVTVQPLTTFKLPPFKKLIVPLALGSLAALVQCALFSGRSPISVVRPSIRILVAQDKIVRGTAIEDARFGVIEMPDDALSDQFISEDEFAKAKGRRLLMGLAPGQAVPKSFLLSELQQKSVPEKIPPGKRLYVFDTSLGELSGLLKPTDHIDVLADLRVPEFGQATITLLENITVVGIGSDIDGSNARDKRRNDSISLYVTPQEAEYLTFAKKYGSFSIVLRNPMDAAAPRNAMGGMTLNQFMNSPRIKGIRENDIFEIIKGRKIK